MFGWRARKFSAQAPVARQRTRETGNAAREIARNSGNPRLSRPVAVAPAMIPGQNSATQNAAPDPETPEPGTGEASFQVFHATGQTSTTWSTAEGTSIAKPPHLQGAGASRTVSGEAQIQLPTLVVNEIMIAAYSPGGTGVTGVDYIDLNITARAWAEDT